MSGGFDLDDDGWEDMPIVRSEPNALGLDDEDEKRYHYKAPTVRAEGGTIATGNAAGTALELDARVAVGQDWRGKLEADESDYTRLRLEEDIEADEVHMRTKYLFDEEKAMTPLSQMQATKNLLTETQRIAYVGLCKLAVQEMVEDLRKVAAADPKRKAKAIHDDPAVDGASVWGLKIMARLYHHMELERDEQKMIESLAAHGVEPMDLVPSLMTTHTVANPEYDPAEAEKFKREEAERLVEEAEEQARLEVEHKRAENEKRSLTTLEDEASSVFGQGDDDEGDDPLPRQSSSPPPPRYSARKPSDSNPFGNDDEEDDIGYIPAPSPPLGEPNALSPSTLPVPPTSPNLVPSSSSSAFALAPPPTLPSPNSEPSTLKGPIVGTKTDIKLEKPAAVEEDVTPVLPGVSTTLTAADENITLDIRWTILCDLFLALIADSVYDARSRVLLERVASKLGLGLLDVVRFEKRVTDSLEIQEGVEKMEQTDVIDGRQKSGRNKRLVAIGLATLGGGLVIGLSAGLLAPVIGAALGGALTSIGVGGTTGFLAGAGGAAVITTGGVVTGSSIATKGMMRRTQYVRTFELKPLHNQKRINCFITVPGFMNSKEDDVRLPFSTLDPMIGDVFSVLWEPDMMAEMGNALKILTTEVLTNLGQTVLQATVMTALVSALQWPLILTKLGYLIDNPWSNALDRAKAAGLVLADTLINRHVGVRPVSLVGFSLGARAIFYALVELARLKAYGIVQDVYLFGGTITANKKTWLEVRSVVSGRFLNGYARNDWVLGYLFRATAAGNTVAGLRPVEGIPGLENRDITDLIAGHLSYRPMMPLLLHTVGLPVTADYFDEPEEPDFEEDRIIIADEELEERKAAKKRWFHRKKKTPVSSSSASASVTRPPSMDVPQRSASSTNGSTAGEHELYDDDLPPREPGPALSSGFTPRVSTDAKTGGDDNAPLPTADPEMAPSPVSKLPPTAGFDFKAISNALGKDIDVSALKAPSAALPVPSSSIKPPLERSESTPPAEAPTPFTLAAPPSSHLRLSALVASSMDDLASSTQHALSFENSHASSISQAAAHSSPWSSSTSPHLPVAHSRFSSTPNSSTRDPPPSFIAAVAPVADESASVWGNPLPSPPPPPKPRASFAYESQPELSFGGVDGDITLGLRATAPVEEADPWAVPLRKPGRGPSALENPWN